MKMWAFKSEKENIEQYMTNLQILMLTSSAGHLLHQLTDAKTLH